MTDGSGFLPGDWDLLAEKYNVAGPRYTSYPTAVQFSSPFPVEALQREATRLGETIAPLSLYVHVPFCSNICYYCACNKVITKDHAQARQYLDYLHREIRMASKMYGRHRPVRQLHWGGGTPTFLNHAELTELMYMLACHFQLSGKPDREYSIELDPRTLRANTLALLKGLGFNRLSLGIQDFSPRVQRAINRIQPHEDIVRLMDEIRGHHFQSVSFDLIYGLPFQTRDSMQDTLEKVLTLSPDRVSLYSYAHLPAQFMPQRAIDRQQLPSPQEKLAILRDMIEGFTQAGYLYVGMDHFVKPGDELAQAMREGRLQRNFQGYSCCLAPDLVGLGVSAISSVGDCMAQNEKTLPEYYRALDENRLPVARGLTMTRDDRIRHAVIMALLCRFEYDTRDLARDFGEDFDTYFAGTLPALASLCEDGLLRRDGSHLEVTVTGRLLIRSICMAFDAYLPVQPAPVVRHSRVI